MKYLFRVFFFQSSLLIINNIAKASTLNNIFDNRSDIYLKSTYFRVGLETRNFILIC